MCFNIGGKYGSFVLINKWCSWVQSALHAIQLYVQSGSNVQYYFDQFVILKYWNFWQRHQHFWRQNLFPELFLVKNQFWNRGIVQNGIILNRRWFIDFRKSIFKSFFMEWTSFISQSSSYFLGPKGSISVKQVSLVV